MDIFWDFFDYTTYQSSTPDILNKTTFNTKREKKNCTISTQLSLALKLDKTFLKHILVSNLI